MDISFYQNEPNYLKDTEQMISDSQITVLHNKRSKSSYDFRNIGAPLPPFYRVCFFCYFSSSISRPVYFMATIILFLDPGLWGLILNL